MTTVETSRMTSAVLFSSELERGDSHNTSEVTAAISAQADSGYQRTGNAEPAYAPYIAGVHTHESPQTEKINRTMATSLAEQAVTVLRSSVLVMLM